MLIPLLLAALQSAPGGQADRDTQPAFRPDSADLATAYADARTRALVRRARESRGTIDASVFRYRAAVRQRLSVSVRAFRRDRLVYRRETAARIDWRRDGPGRLEILGAREAVPIAIPGVRIPDDLEQFALDLVPEPGGSRLMLSADGDGFAWHPLIEGGEAVYRYAIGDSTQIRLPDGRTIRLVELRVTPRERDIRLIAGSFWIDADTHAIVQAVFRPSREFDFDRDLPTIDPGEDTDDVPGILKPIRLDIRYITVDYGLWEMRWWMPRSVLLDGYMQMGPAEFPISFEIAYADYEVEADRHGLPELPPLIRHIAGDPTSRPRQIEPRMRVVIPDSAALLDSPLLPESLYDTQPLVSEQELRELAGRLEALPPVPWAFEPPRVTWPWELRGGLIRYNRVEGLSVGARVDADLGRARADLTARIGTADLVPMGELGIETSTLRSRWRFAWYHRLAVADPTLRPFDLGSSLNAILFGRDEGSYFRASGAELRISPAPGVGRYELRVYAEYQADVDRNTDFSLARVVDGRRFQPNLQADPAAQAGIAATLDLGRGLDPTATRWGVRLAATAETGDHTFLRPGLSAYLGVPLAGGLLGAVELAGGTTLPVGAAADAASPRQAWWQLGGPATVRGFAGTSALGPDYARARVELATGFPAARLALFSDAGWAGQWDGFDRDAALVSVGVGASFLDGLLRVDLARTVQPDRHWRLEVYTDALF